MPFTSCNTYRATPVPVAKPAAPAVQTAAATLACPYFSVPGKLSVKALLTLAAAIKQREAIMRGARLGEERHQPGQRLMVIIDQLVQPRGQAGKR